MSDIKKAIQSARPPLSLAAPLTYSICWGFAIVNLLIGVVMIFLYSTPVPIAIADFLSYQAWGVIFLALSATTSYGLISNKWSVTKRSQLAGIAVKTVWLIALIVRCFADSRTSLITGVWLFFAYVQVMTYVHFIPNNGSEDRAGYGD